MSAYCHAELVSACLSFRSRVFPKLCSPSLGEGSIRVLLHILTSQYCHSEFISESLSVRFSVSFPLLGRGLGRGFNIIKNNPSLEIESFAFGSKTISLSTLGESCVLQSFPKSFTLDR